MPGEGLEAIREVLKEARQTIRKVREDIREIIDEIRAVRPRPIMNFLRRRARLMRKRRETEVTQY